MMASKKIMNLSASERMIVKMTSGPIEGSGWFKLWAKQSGDGEIFWLHFTLRPSGEITNIYTGRATDRDELTKVIEIMNRHLKKIFHVTMEDDNSKN